VGFASVTPRDRLAAVLAPDLLDTLDEFVAERVASEMARLDAHRDLAARWLTLEQAAERLGCSAAAVRMRAGRGRLESRHHGRCVYISAASVAELGRGT
jgi:hypothetical protein